jgi:uncharacterized membrane protein YdjX (TVP38/TMEM64 family)
VRRTTALLALMALLVALGVVLPVRAWIVDLLGYCRGAGPVGVVLYGAAFLPAALLMLPSAPLALGAGYTFGPVVGALVSAVGASLGATLAFEVGRHAGGDLLARVMRRSRALAPFGQVLEHAGFEVVLWLRLSPLAPFFLLNYAFGTTGMRARTYAAATGLALLPGCAMYAALGSLLGSPEQVAAGDVQHGGVLAASAVALTVAAAVAARRRLPGALARDGEPRRGPRR